ncbi:MAG: globin [Gammaproteobacteria bacterium]
MKNYLGFFLDSLYRATGGEAQQHDFLTRFYELFIESSPAVAAHFRDVDMQRQKQMLGRSLQEMTDFSTSRAASEHLRRTALRHSRRDRDIDPDLYDLWLENLIATAREFDLEFNEEVELAWRVVLAPGIAYMKFKYDHG